MIGARRRFWTEAAAEAEGGLWAVRLDRRALMTPAGLPLCVPTRALGEAIAAEWAAVDGMIRPETMPLTRAANTSIDAIAPNPEPVVDMLAAYGGTDLICYRAEGPAALRARQFAAWDPMLAWASEALDAPLVAVMGVMHVPQPVASLAALRGAVAAHDAFGLAALSDLVTLTGSLVLGLAVARGALDADTAWRLSRLDEQWQEEQWGVDAEAAEEAALRHRALCHAERLLSLLRG
jgi:chaperone required for assembly of F1-ATPase